MRFFRRSPSDIPVLAPSEELTGLSGDNLNPRLSLSGNRRLEEEAAEALCAVAGVENIPREDMPKNPYFYLDRRYHACGNLKRAKSGKIDFIWLPIHGRIGNHIIQLVYATAFAKAHGISKIYHDFEWMPPTSRLGEEQPSPAYLRGRPSLLTREAGFRTAFFYKKQYPAIRDLTPGQYAQILRDHLRGYAPWLPVPPARDMITVNIRGGDIMKLQKNPPIHYVSPPVSFYIKAVEHAVAETGRNRLDIVSEDRANPAVDALEYWAREQGMDVVIDNERTVERDIHRLLAAEYLIAGFTTFAESLALLSENLKSFYYFRYGWKIDTLVAGLENVYRGYDSDESYTPPNRWKNTLEQRRAIVDFPIEKIELDRCSKGREL